VEDHENAHGRPSPLPAASQSSRLQLRLARYLYFHVFQYITVGNRTPPLACFLGQREWRLLEVRRKEDGMAEGAIVQRREQGRWGLRRAEGWHGLDL